jgi:hypothetical protein
MDARTFSVKPVGIVHADDGSFSIEIAGPFRPALRGLGGFGHILVLWWGDRVDTEECRGETTCKKPYAKGPETLGIFATRRLSGRTRSRSRQYPFSASIPPRASSRWLISMPTTARRCST